jgi:hypothetical protein
MPPLITGRRDEQVVLFIGLSAVSSWLMQESWYHMEFSFDFLAGGDVMTEDGPLEGIKGTDWGQDGRYGALVPELLAKLLSADPEDRSEAGVSLYNHGVIEPATVLAIPFLYALACDQSTPDRAQVVDLLGAIATSGEDYLDQDDRFDIASFRRDAAGRESDNRDDRNREWREWIAAGPEGDRKNRELRSKVVDPSRTKRQKLNSVTAYDAVQAGVPALCTLLTDADDEVRAFTAYVLRVFPERSEQIRLFLTGFLAHEEVPGALATGIMTSWALGISESITETIAAFFHHPNDAVRLAAAAVLARQNDMSTAAVGELAARAGHPYAETVPVVRYWDSVDGQAYAWRVLREIEEILPRDSETAILDALSQYAARISANAVEVTLSLTFGPAYPPYLPYEELTQPQQRTIRILASVDDRQWNRRPHAKEILRKWGLPDNRNDLARFAGIL